MTGSFGLLSEAEDYAHYGNELAHTGDEMRDRRDSEVTL